MAEAKTFISVHDLMALAVQQKASDLHITAGLPPVFRVDGRLVQLEVDRLSAIDCQTLIYEILADRQIAEFEAKHQLDLSYGASGIGRFRVNVYMQRGSIAAAFRPIPSDIPSIEELNLPLVIGDLAKRTSGLVLVTGPTGCGKSTTLASVIDVINKTHECHILTIEDPIEYLHRHQKAMVNQRELGSDTFSFAEALRASSVMVT